MKVTVDAVQVGTRKRELGDITSLAQSMNEVGLLNPITILPDRRLVAGYHRLQAAKSLGWQEIEANVVDLHTLDAELAEIDENLIRNELHWFDRDKQLARRKEIYEVLHPETKNGAKGGWHSNKTKDLENEIISFSRSFTNDTAKKTGQTPRKVELSIQRAKTFTEHDGEILKRADVKPTEATKLARKPEPEREAVIQALATGKAKNVKEAQAVAKREELVERAKLVDLPETIQLLCGNFLEAGASIAENSVDLVFTDPPYHDEHLGLWSDLGLFASRVLKPGGILLAYSGQVSLPSVLNALSEHLDYCWLLGQYHKGQHLDIWKYKIWNNWKPLVLFSKGRMTDHEWFIDAYDGVKGDKEAHEWAQGEDEAQYFIQKLTEVGALVVDPMCGSGPIVRMAHRFKRRAIGIERDQQRYEVALGGMSVLEVV